jgi:hypothetical protein
MTDLITLSIYDTDNVKIAIYSYNYDKLISKEAYQYDNEGNLV